MSVTVVCVLLVAAFLYKQYLVFTRDAPPEYLNEQSVVEPTRNEHELAIHKSTKLDYSSGLRVGLAIRYNHYKLRNGNLRDVWELLMAAVRRNPRMCISSDDASVNVALLNSQAHQLIKVLDTLLPALVAVPFALLSDLHAWAVVIACFLSQTTVHFYDSIPDSIDSNAATLEREGVLLVLRKGNDAVPLSDIDLTRKLLDFDNVYHHTLDRGIAVRLTTRANHKASVTVDFTQGNLVASLASCIKHLPPGHQLSPADKMVIVQDFSLPDGFMNGLVKMLACFVTGTEVHLASPTADFMRWLPTVLSAPADTVKRMDRPPRGILDTLCKQHRLFSLHQARFSTLGLWAKPYPALRLVYAHRLLNSGEYTNWNGLRASLFVHVIEEVGYFNACGPLLTTDFYEFRNFPKQVTSTVGAFGAVCQANEIKLLDFDGTEGTLAARGYNMGKARTVMANVGENVVRPDADGFYLLLARARWGADGCLYVVKS